MDGSRRDSGSKNVARGPTVPATLGATLVALLAVPAAAAQTTPGALDSTARSAAVALPVGLNVIDPAGTTLGKIEHVLAGADGGIRQVLVRTGGIARVRSSLKALPAAGLTLRGQDAVATLTREELQALPDATAPEPEGAAPGG